jgi:hypothetical protein
MDVNTFKSQQHMDAQNYRELIERYRVMNPRKFALKRESFEKKLAQLEGRQWPPVVEPVKPVVEAVEPVIEQVEVIKPKKAKKVVDNEEGI